MDKNAIKKYAVWARRELIERVSQRAMIYGITAKDAGDPNAESVNGHLLSQKEKWQRQALNRNIKEKGYEQVMEEVAYTWFNRFAALRFMEVNGYLPSHIRVFTNDEGEFKPQILAEAIHLELDGLDKNRVYELESANKSEELFKYLLIVQCNALNSILPSMFQRIDDYTELLLPDYLLREGSVIEQMIAMIPEEDWTDQVQIIGWLYQYYNTEPKDKVFADLKKNIKISKEKIPAATQLFTPDWIVRYMVENSLGRLWLEGHPAAREKFLPAHNEDGSVRVEAGRWNYYLDEAEQEPEVQAQLAEIRKGYAALKPEELRVIDPCCGSGHILAYLFDVLVQIYEDFGYTAREAASSIVKNNLWGLDIDERAAQLSYFAVMMKARQYDRRFFARKVQPHVYAIEESNGITSAPMHDMGINLTQEEYGEAVKQTMRLVEEMHDAKEYGSIMQITPCNWDLLRRFAVPRDENGQLHLDVHREIEASARLQVLINIGEALSQKYHAVVTNPPYMGSKSMSAGLANYVQDNYATAKYDLFAAFIQRGLQMTCKNGFSCLVTMQSWMFLSSFEKMRTELLTSYSLCNLMHLGNMVMGIAFGTSVSSFRKVHLPSYKASFIYVDNKDIRNDQPSIFPTKCKRNGYKRPDAFFDIPGNPIAFWASDRMIQNFVAYPPLGELYELKQGLITADNERFLRQWSEVPSTHFISGANSISDFVDKKGKWLPYNKGGEYRKWYGNNDLVVNWENEGFEIRNFKNDKGKVLSRPQNIQYFGREGASWSIITNGNFSLRYTPTGFGFDARGSMMFAGSKSIHYGLALMCSNVARYYLDFLSPTVSFEVGNVSKVPFIYDIDRATNIIGIAKENVRLSKDDWDSFETSWDFKEHPFITSARWAARVGKAITIKQVFDDWKGVADGRFRKLKENEEELNRLFIDIYGLGEELIPEIEDKDVTARRADLQREIKSLISYAVGCMFGRYSLDVDGLILAGQKYESRFLHDPSGLSDGIPTTMVGDYIRTEENGTHIVPCTFSPDRDNILPICDDEYFEDDIVSRFVEFVRVVYGADTLEENLRFIADALGGKGSPREIIRSYFLNDFYADHLKVYQKRPIYWLFDSGKKNGFKCLIYMHRYQPDTIARIRTDYVHEQQSRYRTAIADLEQRISGASTSERVKLTKQLTTLQAQAEEIRVYEEKIHHLADQMIRIDLDDGMKVNYAKFQDVLAKIK